MSGEGEKVVHGPEKEDNNTKKTARRTFEFGQVPEANEQYQVTAAGPSAATTSSGLLSPTKSPTKAQLFSGLARVAKFLEEEDQRMLQVHGFSHVEIPCERLEIVLERDRKEHVRRRVRAEREGRASNLEVAVAGDEEKKAEKRDKKFKQDEKKERKDDEEDVAAEQQQQKVKKGGKKKNNKRMKTRRDEEQVVVAVTGQEEDEEEFGGEPGPSNLEKTEQQPEKEDEAEEKRKKRKSQQAGTEVEEMVIAGREVEEGEEAEKEDKERQQKHQQKMANEKVEGESGPHHQPAEEDNMVNNNSSSSKQTKFNKNSSKKRKPKQQQTQHQPQHNGLIVNPSSSQQQQQLSQSLPLLPLPMPSPNDDGGLGLSAAVEGGGAGGCRGVRRRRKRASDIVMDQQTTQQKQPATTTAAAAAMANSTQIAAKPKKTQLDGAEELTMREGETVRRAHVREAITAALQRRSTAANMFFSPKRYRDLGKQIEQELHNAHHGSGEGGEKEEAKEFGPKYDLWFNDFVAAVNDEQNGFFREVLRDKVPLKSLVLMSSEQMSAAPPVAMANNNAAKGNRGGGGNDKMPIPNSNNNAISSQMPMWTSTILADADSTSVSTIFDTVTHTRHTTSTQDDGSLDTFNGVSTCSLEMVPMQIIDDCNNVHEKPPFDVAANILPDQVDRSPAHFHDRSLRNANGSSSNRGGIYERNSQLDFAEMLRAKLRAKLQRKEAAASQLPTQNGSNISAFDAAFDALAEYGDLGTDAIAIGELDAADLREEEEEAAEKEQQHRHRQIGPEFVNPNVNEPVPVTAAGGFAAAEEGGEQNDGIEGGGIEDPQGGGNWEEEFAGLELEEEAGMSNEMSNVATALDGHQQQESSELNDGANAKQHPQQQMGPRTPPGEPPMTPDQQQEEPCLEQQQQLERAQNGQNKNGDIADDGSQSAEHNLEKNHSLGESALSDVQTPKSPADVEQEPQQLMGDRFFIPGTPPTQEGENVVGHGEQPAHEELQAAEQEMPSDDIVGETPVPEELQLLEEGELLEEDEEQPEMEDELLELDGEEDEEQPEMEDEQLELDGEEDEEQHEVAEDQLVLDSEEDEEQFEVEGELLELDGEEYEEQPEMEDELLELDGDGEEDEEQPEMEDEQLELDGKEDEEQFEVEEDQLELYGEDDEEQQPEMEDEQLEHHGEEDEEQQPEMEDELLELDDEEDEEQLEVEEELLEYEAENEQDDSQRNMSWPRSAVERRTSSASGSRGAMPVTFQFNISNMANGSANCSNGSRGWAADRSPESSIVDENISPHQPTAFGLEMAGGRLQRSRNNWNRTATTMNGTAVMVDGRQNRSPAAEGGGRQNHRLQQQKQQQKFMAMAERGGGEIYHACAKAKVPMDSRANLPAKLPSYNFLAKCSSSSGGHSSSNNNTFWHGPPAKSWHGPATGPTTISSNRTQEWKRGQQQQRNGHRQPQVKLNWWYDDNHTTVNPNNNSVNCKSNSKMPKKQQPMAPPQHPAHQMPMSNLKKRPAAGILPNAIFDFIHYTHSAAGTKTAAGFRSPREGAKKRPANTNGGGGGGGGNSEQKSGFFFNYSPTAAGHQSFGPREEEHGGDHRQDQFRQPMATWRNDCVEPPDRKRMRLRDGHQHHGHARAIKKN